LEVDGGGNPGHLVVSEPAPGAFGTKTWTLSNTGTVGAYADVNVSLTESGQLGNYMTAHLVVIGGDTIYGPTALNGIAGGYDSNILIMPGGSINIALEWRVDAFYTPVAGDRVEVGLTFNINPVP
jgi:hypothetical protein